MITHDTHGQLACLNWQTLSDQRAATVRPNNGIFRTAFIVTGACNFACPYCKTVGPGKTTLPTMKREKALALLESFANQGLRELRISGGEPTIVPWLPELVALATSRKIRVAISSNGYADLSVYDALVDAGVAEFSISLDSLDAEEADRMSGGRKDVLARVTRTIRHLSSRDVKVYIGMVCCGSGKTPESIQRVLASVAEMGVTDVKIMPPSQDGNVIEGAWLPEELTERFPFLAWRSRNFNKGKGVRGIPETSSPKCFLALDDATISGEQHYPCNVYLREGGAPIGNTSPTMMADRAAWCEGHNSHEDPICRGMCMDLLRAYNDRAQQLQA